VTHAQVSITRRGQYYEDEHSDLLKETDNKTKEPQNEESTNALGTTWRCKAEMC